jgi:hypothetical protein
MILSVAVLMGVSLAGTPKCDIRVGELVPNAQVARAIAEAIISGHQTLEERRDYVLEVEPDGQVGWIVYQSHADIPPDADGNFTITVGGGLSMRINRCNGAISKVCYQR